MIAIEGCRHPEVLRENILVNCFGKVLIPRHRRDKLEGGSEGALSEGVGHAIGYFTAVGIFYSSVERRISRNLQQILKIVDNAPQFLP
jgi:hypothetical protein